MPIKYIVQAGESIPSIAKDQGHLWRTIWDHPDNAGLKAQRKDPNVLLEGDVVVLPDLVTRTVSRSTGGRYRFVRKGEPTRLKLTLTRLGQPRAAEAYELIVDGKKLTGTTDAQGRIDHQIPGNAKQAVLHLRGGKEQRTLLIGYLDPADQVSGVQQRLRNLGFDCADEDGELGLATEAALRAFQERQGLPATGGMNQMTIEKLKSLHN